MIAAISAEQKQLVIAETQRFIRLAEQLFSRQFEAVPIVFDLKGRAAGMYKVVGEKRVIRYNPYLFAKYFSENLQVTVPHEVAHYVVEQCYGLRRTRPHGKEWRQVMAFFNVDDSVTADFDLAGIPTRKERRFAYRCDCREHQLSTRRHNKIHQQSVQYRCRHCDGTLAFIAATA